MDPFVRVDLHLFSFILCIVMLCTDIMLSEKRKLQNRLFRSIIVMTMVILVFDLVGVYTNSDPRYLAISTVAEMLLFIATPLPSCIWAFYVSYQLFQNISRLRAEMRIMLAVVLITSVLAVLSPAHGYLFWINAQNVYVRGPLFFLIYIVAFSPLVYSTVLCIAYRKKVSRKLLLPLLLFPLPPILASLMQILFYGISVIWASITLSIFIICVSIQVRQHNIDHLTGAFNRRQLDTYLTDCIKSARRGRPFSCIMLDIDNFKAINDTCGHVVGDEALFEAAELLRSCIRSEDFLSRYAGDEFIIVLDMASKEGLRQTVERIHARAAEYNRTSTKPFKLSFSVGFDIYNQHTPTSRDDFIARIDALMYENKTAKKEFLQIEA